MTAINADQIVPQEIRDQVFKELYTLNKNNMCIDCQKKNPKWASIHLGVHLCIDCAGKHRQYGVMYSFVKSANLDKWNRKQLLFMQKGGNQRALDYLTKCGVISETHKHIDYKSPIVQRYKTILTTEVDTEIEGKPANASIKQTSSKKAQKVQQIAVQNTLNAPKQIPNAETVQSEEKGKKKNKKKIGKKINLQDFDNLVLDDGVPIQEKQKIVKAYESSTNNIQQQKQQRALDNSENHNQSKAEQAPKPEIPQQKQMTQEQSKQKLEELKAKQNVKSISSDQFKDTSVSETLVKQNLNKFSGSSSISSNALFGGQDSNNDEGSMDKIKGFVSDAGGKIYNKLSSYWAKN